MIENATTLPSPPKTVSSRRGWLALLLALAVARTLLLGAFMADPLRTKGSPCFYDVFYLQHNCLTAYVHAAELAEQKTENIYLTELYLGQFYGPFRIDEFFYPPPFLLLPAALLAISPDFLDIRLIFFLLDVAVLALAFWLSTRAFGGELGRRAGLAALLVWASTPFLLTLQIGNFQLLAFALSLLAMLAFRREQPLVGGALLAFTAVSKIFPGVLILYLLFRRRYRDVAFTAGWAVVWILAGLAAFGVQPLRMFVTYELPRIASGEAFAFLRFDEAWWVRAINMSVPSLGLKIGTLFGTLPPPGVDKAFSLIYSALLIVFAWVAARRPAAASFFGEAQLAIALLSLGALRSPFVPDTYALIGPLWLWSLQVAAVSLAPADPAAGSRRRLWLWLLMLLPLAFVLPVDGPPLPEAVGRVLLSLPTHACALILILRALWRPFPAEPAAGPA